MLSHEKDTICLIRAVYYKNILTVINCSAIFTDFIPYYPLLVPKMKAELTDRLYQYFPNSHSFECVCNKTTPVVLILRISK